MTWVCTGDSITQAVFHTHGSRGWVEHCHERIRWQLGRLEDVVINTGMSGWTAPQVLDRFDHLVGRFSPDVVSISLGTNDAHVDQPGGPETFATALRELVQRSASLQAQVVLHTPVGQAESATRTRPRPGDFSEVVRVVAQESGATLVDHAAHWQDAYPRRSGGQTEPLGWLDDGIHPNAEGHRVMTDLTVTTLGLGPDAERP